MGTSKTNKITQEKSISSDFKRFEDFVDSENFSNK